MNHYIVKTLGCKANLYDSQLIEAELQKRGWTPGLSGKDKVSLCIVNSCTVTDEADHQSRKMAARLSRENPDAVIVVTGCAAEVDPERLASSKGITYVIGNRSKPQLVNRILERLAGVPSDPRPEWPDVTESFFTPPTRLQGHSSKTRAFLKIQEGCNSFCTYCIIPYGRGPSRSLKPREVVMQVQELVSQGIKEIVITGTNIGDYGTDWCDEPRLVQLLQLVLSETELQRLRVSSLDPTEITPELIALMEQNPRFCPHFHVSLQSPHSRILRLMKRRYKFEHVKECLERISSLGQNLAGGAFVGMDVITGFPGETEAEFEWTREALASLPWSRLHVFPYSERKGTPATRLPHAIPQNERIRRARLLNELSLEKLSGKYRQVLEEQEKRKKPLGAVLLESGTESLDGVEHVVGHTTNYLRVLVPKSHPNAKTALGRNDIIEATPRSLYVDTARMEIALVATTAANPQSQTNA